MKPYLCGLSDTTTAAARFHETKEYHNIPDTHKFFANASIWQWDRYKDIPGVIIKVGVVNPDSGGVLNHRAVSVFVPVEASIEDTAILPYLHKFHAWRILTEEELKEMTREIQEWERRDS